jgi:single-strand DNA-binding protein
VGKDPEQRAMNNGKPVVSFSLAVSEKWSGGERTEWISAVVFNEKLCEIVMSYIKKGSKIYLSGQMQTRKWQDQQGVDKYKTEIVLNYDGKIIMLDSREQSEPKRSPDYQAPVDDLDDDIPF